MYKGSRERKPNRLIHEKSPYLLQHAYNPVDWYPWSEAAFAEAVARDKPVFVSIGYSSCHWCHVMEKESFEDEEVAMLMNDAFVCIKVDREERPDIDSFYMKVCQLMGQNCGWPLNLIMTPNKNPFFVATYIPKNSRFGAVGMTELIPYVKKIWETRRLELEAMGIEIRNRIELLEKRSAGAGLDKTVLDDAYEWFVLNFDSAHGGFYGAPKFPVPHNLLFLLRYWYRTKEKEALEMVQRTLRAMRLGGIFDQVGFGFHRYSTDAEWLVPHFEKMLYDQALLVLAYIEAYQATGDEMFKVTAEEILEYVLRDLASPEGVFYSSEDADSEGEEGKFYLWTEEEIKSALDSEDAALAIRIFGIKPEGNYAEAIRRRSGRNILHLVKPVTELTHELHLPSDEFNFKLNKILHMLFETRERRVHPAKDTKVLLDWNGLMIAALAKASFVLNKPLYLKAAVTAAEFILRNMKSENGTLYHIYAKGEKAVSGFLDDYAFFVWGLLEIYAASFENKYLQTANELTQTMIEKFWDKTVGGFYFTAKDVDESVARIKEVYDGAMPSGNSVALLNLLRLARLTSEPAYETMAQQLLKIFSEDLKRAPAAHTFMLTGLDFAVGPTYQVTLVGDTDEENMRCLLNALKSHYLPNVTVSLRSNNEVVGEKIEGKATAYVCSERRCLPPTNDAEKMLRLLGISEQ
ncbi:MAG: thioredoxin domain-containing protein [Candidatus Bathyarchaeota archaeon]|nr:thioredoxin domain-containing protein [Candidatus Bathyarchaeota archaeon]